MENKDGKIQLFGSEVNFSKENEGDKVSAGNNAVAPDPEVKLHTDVNQPEAKVQYSTPDVVKEQPKVSLSNAAKLAIDYQRKGIIPSSVPIPEDLTPEAMSDMIKNNIYTTVHQKAQEDVVSQLKDLGYDKNTLKRARLLALGASDEQIVEIGKYKQAATYKPQTSEEMEYFVKNYFIHKGMDKERAERLVGSASNDELKKDFEEGVSFFNNHADKLEESLKETKRSEAAQREREEKELDDSYRRVIDSRKIGKVSLTETEANSLKDSIFKKTEVTQMPDGSSAYITRYEKALKDLDSNNEGQIWIARAILNKSWEMEEVNGPETKRSILADLGAEIQKASNVGDVEPEDGKILLFGN